MIRSKPYLQSIETYNPVPTPAKAIKMSANENPLGTSPLAAKRIQEMAKMAFRYPDGNGTALKKALATRYKLHDKNIIIGNGSDELFTLLSHVYMEEECHSLSSETTFSEYTFATKIFGGHMVQLPLQQGSFDLEAIARAVNNKSKLIFLCNPNNPTGTYFNHQQLISFMNKIPERVLVVLDEAYADYMDCHDPPQIQKLLMDFSNIIILRTFSKIYGLAGLRIGYGMACEQIINDLDRVREPFNTNAIAQEAALAALSDKEFKNLSLANNRQGKNFLYHQLNELGLTYYQTQGNFICIDLKSDCQRAFKYFMARGLIIRPLSSFGLTNWIRVTIGKPEDNRFFIDILKGYLNDGQENQ